jgi:hypothetical protein
MAPSQLCSFLFKIQFDTGDTLLILCGNNSVDCVIFNSSKN